MFPLRYSVTPYCIQTSLIRCYGVHIVSFPSNPITSVCLSICLSVCLSSCFPYATVITPYCIQTSLIRCYDVQIVSFPSNPITWDKTNSPHVTNAVIGLTLKTDDDDPKEIAVKNTKKDIEIFAPVSLDQAQQFSNYFRANEFGAIHRYRLVKQNQPRHPLLVYVKPEDGQTLTVYFRLAYDVSMENFDLEFTVPNSDSQRLAKHFRRVDPYSFMVEEHAPEFDKVSLGIKAANLTGVTVNYTVYTYGVSCMYWSEKELHTWERTGCRVISFGNLCSWFYFTYPARQTWPVNSTP